MMFQHNIHILNQQNIGNIFPSDDQKNFHYIMDGLLISFLLRKIFHREYLCIIV